jgi:hypothetical protein
MWNAMIDPMHPIAAWVVSITLVPMTSLGLLFSYFEIYRGGEYSADSPPVVEGFGLLGLGAILGAFLARALYRRLTR